MNTIAIGIAINHKRVIFGLRWPKLRTILDAARSTLAGFTLPMASYGMA